MGGGTLLAQIIGLISTPIVTRLYLPSDFGVLALFISFISIIVVAASFRYENAYPIQKDEKCAVNLFALCILLLIVNTIILSVILYLGGDKISTYFGLVSIKPYFWLLVVGFSGSGLNNIYNYWAIRQREYSVITYIKIYQTVSGSISKILMGFFLFGPLGLIISFLISQIIGINTYMRKMLKKEETDFSFINYKDIKSVARQNSSFPIYSLPSSIFNSITLALPVIMLSSIYGLEVTGMYSLAYGVLVSPVSFISASISQVYNGELSKMIREKKETLTFFLSTIRKLAFIGVPLIGIPAILAPFIFPILFGDIWKDAGWYCIPLSLTVFSAFCVSTTVNLSVFKYNHWQLYWDISRFLLIISGFLIAKYQNFSPLESLLIFSLIMTLLYFIHVLLNICVMKIRMIEDTTNAQKN